MFRSFLSFALLFSTTVVAQELPIDRVAAQEDTIALISSQTKILQAMSEKLSRIETLVIDTNSKVATSAQVQDLLAQMESIKLDCQSPKTVVQPVSVPSVVSPPVIISSNDCASSLGDCNLNAGEYIVAINGVPVQQNFHQPTTTTVRTPFREITTTGGVTDIRAPFVRVSTSNNGASSQCVTDAYGNTTCTNEYNPSGVFSSNNYRTTSRRRWGLFGWLRRN